MKIAQVIHSFPPYTMAGSEIYTYNLSRALSKRHKVFVFHRISNPHMAEFKVIDLSYDGLCRYAINNTFRRCNSFEMTYKNNIVADKFGMFLDEVKPDIVHIQHLLFLSTTIIQEAKKRGIPILFTLHDYWLICHQGQLLKRDLTLCNNHSDSDCIKCLYYQLSIKRGVMGIYQVLQQSSFRFLIQPLKKIYSRYARNIFLSGTEAIRQIEKRNEHIKEICRAVDMFIAPSQFLKKRFCAFGIPKEKIIFSPYGLNSEAFRDFKKKGSNKLRFAYIGTLLPAKGIDILIKAFNRMKDEDVELKIYGKLSIYKGFEYYIKYIKNLARNKNIKFMGGYDNKNVSKILSEIDLIILPSIWYENSPLVIQEARLAGVPVVASRIGGIPELIRDGEDGLLFQPNDVDDLYVKLKTLIKRPGLIEHLRSNINPPKDIETNTGEIEDIYEDLISRNKSH